MFFLNNNNNNIYILLCHTWLNVSWNIFTFHSTSTQSAFEVFFTANTLYKLLSYLLNLLN